MKPCCEEYISLVFQTIHDMTWMIIRLQEGGDRYLWYQKYPYYLSTCPCRNKLK